MVFPVSFRREVDDEDVAAEKARINAGGCTDMIRIEGLKMAYPGTGLLTCTQAH